MDGGLEAKIGNLDDRVKEYWSQFTLQEMFYLIGQIPENEEGWVEI